MDRAGAHSALDWLAAAADDPAACREDWNSSESGMALLPAGRLWDVLIVPDDLGRTALRVLRRHGSGGGPVLADDGGNLGFLVPPGTADGWVGSGVRCAGRGTWVVVPHPGRPQQGPVEWLVAPRGDGELADPAVLETALHEAAARLGGPGRPRWQW